MAIDTSIYAQARPFQMADPLDQALKAMSLRDANRKFTLEDDISQALAQSGGDYSKASDVLAKSGRGAAALQLAGRADAQKKAGIEQELKFYEEAGNDAISLDSIYRQALQQSGGNQQAAVTAAQQAYGPIRDKWRQLGKPLSDNFDPQKNAAFIGQAKNAVDYIKSLTPTPSDLSKLLREKQALPAGSPDLATYNAAIQKNTAATPTELSRLQAERDALPQGDPRRVDYDRAIAAYKPGRGTEVNVSTEKKYGEHFGAKVAEADVGMRDAAMKAPELATRANDVLKVLSSGKVITGSGAEVRLAIGKALGLAGASDAETVSNTEQLAVSLAQNTLDAIKASGLGSGSGFSNADRDFLEKAVGGKITLEETTLKRLAALSHRAAVKSAEKWNTRVKEIPDAALQGTGITRNAIEVPTMHTQSPGASKNPREVSLPNGQVKTFPTPAAAQRFREEAGL